MIRIGLRQQPSYVVTLKGCNNRHKQQGVVLLLVLLINSILAMLLLSHMRNNQLQQKALYAYQASVIDELMAFHYVEIIKDALIAKKTLACLDKPHAAVDHTWCDAKESFAYRIEDIKKDACFQINQNTVFYPVHFYRIMFVFKTHTAKASIAIADLFSHSSCSEGKPFVIKEGLQSWQWSG